MPDPITTIAWRLRLAVDSDREWLYEVHERAMREHAERVYGPWDPDHQRALYDRRDPRNVIEVIENDAATRIGTVHWRRIDDATLEIDLLELDPDWQRRGIGTAVVEAFKRRAGSAALVLRVHKQNVRARRFYARAGILTCGETDLHELLRWEPQSVDDVTSGDSA